MAYGKGRASMGSEGEGVNQHKRMAMGHSAPQGAVGKFPPNGPVETQSKGDPGMHLNDGARGAKAAISGSQSGAMQAAPDHGAMGRDHFARDGKV